MGSALSTSLLIALFAAMALRPPLPRRSTPFNLQFALGWWINEQPFLGLYWLLAGTLGMLLQPEPSVWWWLIAAVIALDVLMLGSLALRARSARPALSKALKDTYGTDTAPRFTRPPWWRIVLLPFISWRADVRRIRNQRYGPARRGNLLDVYVPRSSRGSDRPVLVYLHPRLGSKNLGGHPLLYRLATRGWVCVNANYRAAGYSDQLSDVRAVLAWARAHAREYGASEDNVFLAGGSSGAHLAASAALSDGQVSGVIALYGYYGPMGFSDGTPASPHAYVNPAAPPFLIVHGLLDTLVPHEAARQFAEHLRAVSRQPTVYAELPGTNHNFDFFHSIRCHIVIDAIVRFTELTSPHARAAQLRR